MDRRSMLTALSASALGYEARAAAPTNTFLEIQTWRLHNSAEGQGPRVAEYLEHGLAPALARGGSKLCGAFANVIAPDGPYYVTVSQYASLAAFESALAQLKSDGAHRAALEKLSGGSGVPFVRLESSLLRSFDKMPAPILADASEKRAPRIFELRTYESQSFVTLARKIGMFNDAEMGIFERLGMRPVFFGETIVGPRQPNLMYMLSYDNLAARDTLWKAFGKDPEWAKLRVQPGLTDPEIVANISNVILRPLAFSEIR
jgi:NIPSNAP